MPESKLRVIPLGGLGEIGRNCMLIEYGNDIIMVDAGLMFPEEEMLGVDLVIPDISYLRERADRLRGIFLTHGHEDHIGALPYLLREVRAPIYCTRLTNGLVSVKLKEARLNDALQDLHVVEPPSPPIRAGVFEVEFFRVAHSIPDAAGLVIRTPLGTIIHTGDFKLDHTPVMGQHTDLSRLSAEGDKGILLLCSDSTYAEVSGFTPSEQVVGEALAQIIGNAEGRVIIATFASLIARVQQVIDAAERHGRKVFITGRSMMDNSQMAQELGYLRAKPGTLLRPDEMRKTPHEKLVIICTGSQGEPTSALARMARRDHQYVDIVPGDTVITSSTPIPGNEALVDRVIDNLYKMGARVLYSRIAPGVHVRGHAAQEELKLVLSLVRPRYFLPIHGEYRHLVHHAQLGTQMGIDPQNIFVLEDGDVLEIDDQEAYIEGHVSGDYVYVDGLGVGDVDSLVLRDRKHLASDGMVVVIVTIEKRTGKVLGLPEVVSRGFVDVEESEDLLQRTREVALHSLPGEGHAVDWALVNTRVKDGVARFLHDETHRRPMVLPVAVEV
ncbi:MAG: ribonuclease J [Dehalococcoidia bacterium]|nr:ribonuclease J [Dehalococcoidia bacterium]